MYVELFDIENEDLLDFESIAAMKDHLKIIRDKERNTEKKQEIVDLFYTPDNVFIGDGMVVGNFFEVEVL